MLKSKPKSEFRFWHRNWNPNFGKSKHRNSDEIRLKFCRNFDFVESKKRTFVETLVQTWPLFMEKFLQFYFITTKQFWQITLAKDKSSRKNPRPNFLLNCRKMAEKGPELEVCSSHRNLDYLQKYCRLINTFFILFCGRSLCNTASTKSMREKKKNRNTKLYRIAKKECNIRFFINESKKRIVFNHKKRNVGIITTLCTLYSWWLYNFPFYLQYFQKQSTERNKIKILFVSFFQTFVCCLLKTIPNTKLFCMNVSQIYSFIS
jgi:hypothetical protein